MYIIHQKRKITYVCIVAFIRWKAGRDYFIILNEMVKIIMIKAQPKKKRKKESGPDLECYERVERHEIWIDVGKVNLT